MRGKYTLTSILYGSLILPGIMIIDNEQGMN